jgi:hypothetical protein
LNRERDRHWADSGRAGDWGSAVIVALVLSVTIGAIAIAVFDNPARLASRYGTTTSELPRTAQGGGAPETDGSGNADLVTGRSWLLRW